MWSVVEFLVLEGIQTVRYPCIEDTKREMLAGKTI